MVFALLRIKNSCCELVAIATATLSNPTLSVMCQEMSMSAANVVELHVKFVDACLTSFTSLSGGTSVSY